ncbi:protein kinase, partial [bacterium]|nr:protein kinase [bacterium]
MSEKDSITTCQKCGESLEAGWERCPVCLTPKSSGSLTCPNCRVSVKQSWKLCPYCKTTLSGWKTPPSGKLSAAGKKSDSQKGQVFVSLVGDEPVPAVGFAFDLPIANGDVLNGRYRIIKLLGTGGFGAVYQVDDLVLKGQIALKVVVAGEGKAQHAAEQILHEFKLCEKINDITHIVKAQDPRPCEYKGLSLVLLPMEFADGGSMRQWLAQKHNLEKQRKSGLEFFRQACLGVKAIHEAGLVHLDIKPENILLVKGKAKIA